MDAIAQEPLNLNGEEREILQDVLEAERHQLLIEIRHTDHRGYREELRRRLRIIEELAARTEQA